MLGSALWTNPTDLGAGGVARGGRSSQGGQEVPSHAFERVSASGLSAPSLRRTAGRSIGQDVSKSQRKVRPRLTEMVPEHQVRFVARDDVIRCRALRFSETGRDSPRDCEHGLSACSLEREEDERLGDVGGHLPLADGSDNTTQETRVLPVARAAEEANKASQPAAESKDPAVLSAAAPCHNSAETPATTNA